MERPKNQVFVRNLDPTTSDNEFVSYFQTHYGGVIEGAKIIRDRNGRSKGYGFISFIDRSIVNKVIFERNHLIGGKKVVCKIASPNTKIHHVHKNNETPQHLKEIYVGNLDTNFTLQQLKNYFSYFGSIENARIISDENDRCLGYGFVEFENCSAIDTIQELRPHRINDKEIQTIRVYPRNVPTYMKKPTDVLYVTDYPEFIDENDIEEYFGQFGDIVMVSRKIKRPGDVKLMEIQFEDYDSVDVVCLADNHTINGCTINVSKYLPNHFDKVKNEQSKTQNQTKSSTSFSSSSLPSAPYPEPVHHGFPSNPHPVIIQQAPNAYYETPRYYQQQIDDNEETNCCGGSSQREPARMRDENEDECVIL